MSEHSAPMQRQKQSRINNTIHLWEFLLELLEDERYTSLISWTRKEEGEFKIKRQEDVARKWGRLKQRSSMNYDKLSRALRYYYHKGIIKKVQGQRLVYKFDKLPYSYKPVRYNWPWKLPSEEQDVQPVERDFVTPPVSTATRWPVVSAWKDRDSEQDVKPVKPDIVTPLVAKETLWPMMPWKIPKTEQDVKPVKQENVPPLVSMATHFPVMPAWKVPRRKQDVKPVNWDKAPPLVSTTTHLPALNYGNLSPVSSQSLHRNPNSEFSSFDSPFRRSSPVMCRSQIIFPPCSCMRSVVCGMRMLPGATSVPVKVITRFV